MIHTTIEAMAAASASAQSEVQNVQVGGSLRVRGAPLRADLVAATLLCDQLAAYRVGDGREGLLALEEIVRQAQYNPDDRGAVAQRLVEVVVGDGTYDGKAFACRQLWIIGTMAEVPTLGVALKDHELSDMARYALEPMEYPQVDAALLAALNEGPSSVHVGIINSLVARNSPHALEAIKPLRKSKDKSVADAAKHAIARLEGKTIP